MSPLTPQNFLNGLGIGGAAEAGADGVDQHEIALVEQRVGIVFHAIGRGRHEAIGLEHDAFRPERSHVQPDRSRAGAAVEGKSERPLGGVLAVERVGDVEHFGFDLAIAALDREASGGGCVLQASLPSTVIWWCVTTGGDFGHVEVLFFVFLFVGEGWRHWRLLLGRGVGLIVFSAGSVEACAADCFF